MCDEYEPSLKDISRMLEHQYSVRQALEDDIRLLRHTVTVLANGDAAAVANAQATVIAAFEWRDRIGSVWPPSNAAFRLNT